MGIFHMFGFHLYACLLVCVLRLWHEGSEYMLRSHMCICVCLETYGRENGIIVESVANKDVWRRMNEWVIVWFVCVSFCVREVCLFDTMAEWSKALVLGTSLRAWVRIPLVSLHSLCMTLLPPTTASYLLHRDWRCWHDSARGVDMDISSVVLLACLFVCLHLVISIACLSIVVVLVAVFDWFVVCSACVSRYVNVQVCEWVDREYGHTKYAASIGSEHIVTLDIWWLKMDTKAVPDRRHHHSGF